MGLVLDSRTTQPKGFGSIFLFQGMVGGPSMGFNEHVFDQERNPGNVH